MKLAAIDLFCGVGGLAYGLKRSGIDVLCGLDMDPSCQYPFEKNLRCDFLLEDLNDIDPKRLAKYYPKRAIKVLVGCAPCQPFSSYSHGKYKKKYKKWNLLLAFLKTIKEIKPDLVSMENVLQLEKFEIFDYFAGHLENLGYYVTYYRVDCFLYGVPQTRKRLVLFASRYGPVSLIPSNNKAKIKTVRSTIGNLQPIKAGEISKSDPLHRASRLSEKNLKRIRASKPGGNWRNWSQELIAECHKKETGKTYSGVYGRMEWDDLAPTITTQSFGFGNGRFGHPEQNRAISLREAALLQTFPKTFVFEHPKAEKTFKNIGRLIGNAVPVKLGEAIGKTLIMHIKENKK